jgi:hypothetical protein
MGRNQEDFDSLHGEIVEDLRAFWAPSATSANRLVRRGVSGISALGTARLLDFALECGAITEGQH